MPETFSESHLYDTTVNPLTVMEMQSAPDSGRPVRVVVADDSIIFLRLLQDMLDGLDVDLHVATNGTQAWEMIQASDTPTIAILDWVMPGLEGIDICRKVRERSSQYYVYSILMTAKTSTHEIIEGLQAGADDYIVKPVHIEELRARLLVAQRILRVHQELINTREVLREQATHDHLTRLLNRAGIMDRLEREMDRSGRTGEPLSVLIIDIDHFKQVNDIYGHLAGDQVLAQVAGRIKDSIRSYDAVGRYGGEEFLIVIPGCDEPLVFQVAEKIRQAVCHEPVDMLGKFSTVTVSVGAATRRSEASAEALIGFADAALYRAKAAGRNCTRIAPLSDRFDTHSIGTSVI
jgi:diguanylate cyclase (GGDEF)-like protein